MIDVMLEILPIRKHGRQDHIPQCWLMTGSHEATLQDVLHCVIADHMVSDTIVFYRYGLLDKTTLLKFVGVGEGPDKGPLRVGVDASRGCLPGDGEADRVQVLCRQPGGGGGGGLPSVSGDCA